MGAVSGVGGRMGGGGGSFEQDSGGWWQLAEHVVGGPGKISDSDEMK